MIKEKKGFEVRRYVSYKVHTEIKDAIKECRNVVFKSPDCGWSFTINTYTEEIIEVTPR